MIDIQGLRSSFTNLIKMRNSFIFYHYRLNYDDIIYKLNLKHKEYYNK